MEFGGSEAWLVVVAGGAAALGVAIIVGGLMWLTREKADDSRAERATKRLYQEAAEDEAARERRRG